MIPAIPTPLPMPFAQNGERRVIPENNDVPGSADASWATGFPPVTRINKQAGGKPPYGLDFQGIFYTICQHLFYAQSGNLYPWVGASEGQPGLNYLKGAFVLGSDAETYVALKPSGPDVPNPDGASFVGPVNPVDDTTGHWMDLATMFSVGIATLTTPGIVKPDGTTITIKPDGTISVSVGAVYELGEIYYFRNPTLRPGFQPCQGGLLQQAATLYPQIWAYLQTTEGQQLCKTEAQWQAMTQATWGDGSFKASWNGIGGAPYFVQNLNAGTLRMPDIRGMVAMAAADGTIGPSAGGVMGDRTRPVEGTTSKNGTYGLIAGSNVGGDATAAILTGAFYAGAARAHGTAGGSLSYNDLAFDSGRVVPTGAVNLPRSWGALACCYLGQPAQV